MFLQFHLQRGKKTNHTGNLRREACKEPGDIPFLYLSKGHGQMGPLLTAGNCIWWVIHKGRTKSPNREVEGGSRGNTLLKMTTATARNMY